MNSPFAQLYAYIIDRLREQVPSIRYINQDLMQLDAYETRPAVSFPCVLIDMSQFSFESIGANAQQATGTITLRIAHTPYSNSSSLSPEQVREKALSYYELEWQIYKVLQGWGPGIFSPLKRIDASAEKREDDIAVRVLSFQTSFIDESASPTYTAVDPTLNISTTLTLEP